RRRYRVADVLAAAEPGVAGRPALPVEHGHRIIAVGPHLLAADEKFWRTVDEGVATVAALEYAARCIVGFEQAALRFSRRQIFVHALAAAFATEAALAVAAEAAGGVEHVGAVDPDDPSLELGG